MAVSLIKSYYDNLRQGKLIGHTCEACGAVSFPPTAACPKCGGFKQTDVELSGKGEVLYVSHSMAPPPNPRFNDLAPYAYGHVKLEEGVFVQAVITGVDIEPDSLRKIFDAGPAPVVPDILELDGLPVLAFKLA